MSRHRPIAKRRASGTARSDGTRTERTPASGVSVPTDRDDRRSSERRNRGPSAVDESRTTKHAVGDDNPLNDRDETITDKPTVIHDTRWPPPPSTPVDRRCQTAPTTTLSRWIFGFGGAREIGRSAIVVDDRLLLDFGMDSGNPPSFPIDDVDPEAVVVSHGHLDHVGSIPRCCPARPARRFTGRRRRAISRCCWLETR